MYYPRSLLKFVVLGFLLVCLPLVVVLTEQNHTLDNLANQSSASVFQSVSVARLSSQFAQQTETLERLAQQYMILKENSVLDSYIQMQQIFQETRQKLNTHLLTSERGVLDEVLIQEALLFEFLQDSKNNKENLDKIIDGYHDLTMKTQVVQSAANLLAQNSVDKLQEMADESQSKRFYFLWASLLIALFSAILIASLIARPLKKINQAIHQLGGADFSKAIEIPGPAELRYLGQRLEWLRSRLQTLETQQTRFLRNMSHELKTPLTAIREGTELLRDGIGGELKPEQREIIHIVRENTLSLQHIIEDLLDFHQSRVMKPDKLLPVDLAETIQHVIREHKLVAWRRLISFETTLPSMLVTGDARKISTIVDNLISNAVKYSPHLGKILVTLRSERGYARLDVIDEGPGIPEDERDKIFDTFYQGAPPPEKEHRVHGSGLGLAITREYVHAHGGKITSTDRKDGKEGTRFIVWLPFWTNTLPLTTQSKTTITKVPIQ